MKHCLSIAGSDCSGGAGIQADLKAFSAHKCYGMSVITSVVAENTSRVISVYNMPAAEVEKQIDAVFEDIRVDAVKLGMLPNAEIIEAVGERLAKYRPEIVVCDPVLVATSGDALSDGKTVSAMRKSIFPLADLITPNIPEAEAISGVKIRSLDDFDKAADVIMAMGVKNLLIKGGHFAELGYSKCVDVLYRAGGERETFAAELVDSQNTHGTGCTLSSAIAANLANGLDMPNAIRAAKEYITEAIKRSFTVGKGHSPVHHFCRFY